MATPHLRSGPSYAGQRIGLLGGSFNPAHEGHREISLWALKQLKLDHIWWLVSPQNPLKSSQDMMPLHNRLQKAKTVARHPKIIATNLETELGTRYTADTLRTLRRRFPHTHFVWLMGADNLQQIPAWHQWAELFKLVPVAVFRRPLHASGHRSGKAAQRFTKAWLPARRGKSLALFYPPAWMVLNNRHNKLSATEIRRNLHKREDR